MATTKKATKSTRSATAKKPAAAKTKTTVRTSTVSNTPSRNVASATGTTTARKLDSNVLNIVLAEVVGTFVLTLVALMAASNVVPLFVGLTLVVLVLTIGAVSGAHVNPAVTFGLWASGKLKAMLIPFYWAAQFLGAMAAIVISSAIAGSQSSLDFGHFMEFSWPVFFIEMIAAAVFLFGLVSVTSRVDLSANAKALGVGLSLFVALVVSGSLLAPAQEQAAVDYRDASASVQADEENTTQPTIPHIVFVEGATVNPAIALAATETQESALTGAEVENEPTYSRLSLEVILSTLLGAAVGANLARLINRRFNV
jgi:glycerol uptake facilitator-like aquaporin